MIKYKQNKNPTIQSWRIKYRHDDLSCLPQQQHLNYTTKGLINELYSVFVTNKYDEFWDSSCEKS